MGTVGLYKSEKKIKPIDAHRPTLSKREIESVLNCLIEDKLGSGEVTRRFERVFANSFGFRHALAVNSLTSAYHLAFLGLGIGPGDRVILSALAPLAACDALRYVGAEPILLDVARGSFHPEEEQIWQLIQDLNRTGQADGAVSPAVEQTQAIDTDPSCANSDAEVVDINNALQDPGAAAGQICLVLDHSFGSVHRLDAEKLRAENIKIIEDFTGLVGSTVQPDGDFFGKQGHVAICGLAEFDLLTTGNGAMLISSEPRLHGRLHSLRYGGKRKKGAIAYDYRLEDFQAAMGLDQLGRLGITLARRKKIGQKYLESLRTTRHENFFKESGVDAYLQFPVVFNKNMEEVLRYYASLQIGVVRAVAYPLHHVLNLPRMQYPNAERFYQRAVSVPIYPALTANNVERISSSVRGLI